MQRLAGRLVVPVVVHAARRVVLHALDGLERSDEAGRRLAARDDAELAGRDGRPQVAADVGRRRVARPVLGGERLGDVVGRQTGPRVGHRDDAAPRVPRPSRAGGGCRGRGRRGGRGRAPSGWGLPALRQRGPGRARPPRRPRRQGGCVGWAWASCGRTWAVLRFRFGSRLRRGVGNGEAPAGYFRPVVAMPSMKRFWKMRKTDEDRDDDDGRTRRAAARSSCCSDRSSRGRGHREGVPVLGLRHDERPQEVVPAAEEGQDPSVARAGPHSGRMIRKKIRSSRRRRRGPRRAGPWAARG